MRRHAATAVPEGSSRTFSKRMLMLNCALIWVAVFYAIYHGQASAVVNVGFALIGTLYSAYVGVGHLDFRRLLAFSAESAMAAGAPGDPADGSSAQESPVAG